MAGTRKLSVSASRQAAVKREQRNIFRKPYNYVVYTSLIGYGGIF